MRLRNSLGRMVVGLAIAAAASLAPVNAQQRPAAGPPEAERFAQELKASRVRATFVHLASESPALLYEPLKPGAKSRIALLVTHGGDYLAFSACTELSKRGYRVLCAAPRDGNLDRMLYETKLGVDYLRKLPGVRKVLLFGHSGGATIVTAYQAIAEGGLKFCQDPAKIHRCADNLANLPPVDGIVMPDANYGNALVMLFSVDPSVLDEHSGAMTDPALDMFNPANGFRPGGTTYSPAFTAKFFAAEGARYTRIVKLAEEQHAAILAGKGPYRDDQPLIVPGGSGLGPNNKLYSQDLRFLSRSKRPWPILRPDGSERVEIMHSVRRPPNARLGPDSYGLAAYKGTVNNLLSGEAIRVNDDFSYDEDTIHGVEWTSSYATPIGNVESITVPILAMGMTGNWEGLAAEMIYDHAKSADKTVAFVQGATHMYDTCKQCETTPGEFGDTRKTLYNYVDKWLSTGRFGKLAR